MAYNYSDIVTPAGRLRYKILSDLATHDFPWGPTRTADLITEMYGMIWLLAEHIANEQSGAAADPKLYVEMAAENWEDGLSVSPGLSNSDKLPS